MNFVADESVEIQIVRRLRDDGHNCFSIQEQSPATPDVHVLSIAASDDRILLTSDTDFGELVFRLRQASAGVILLRLAGLSNESKASAVGNAIALHGLELKHSFAVVEPGRIRIRAR